MEEIKTVLGDRIRKAREEKNITQADLAEYLGCTPMSISYFEKGKRDIRLSDLQSIASYFAKPLGYFLPSDATLYRADFSGDGQRIQKSLDRFSAFLDENKL